MADGEKADKRDPVNVRIGKNISTHRGHMTQVQLAEKMTERGNAWSQATVWNTEQGNRPLKLKEALDLAAILSVSIETLTGSEKQAEFTALLNRETEDLGEAFTEAVDKIAYLAWAHGCYGQSPVLTLTEPEAQLNEVPDETLNKYAETLAECNLSTALLIALTRELRTENELTTSIREEYGSEWIDQRVKEIASRYGISLDPRKINPEPLTADKVRRMFALGAKKYQSQFNSQ